MTHDQWIGCIAIGNLLCVAIVAADHFWWSPRRLRETFIAGYKTGLEKFVEEFDTERFVNIVLAAKKAADEAVHEAEGAPKQ